VLLNVKAQVTNCSYVNFAEGTALTRSTTTVIIDICVSSFCSCCKLLFLKYRLQALVFKIRASYRPLLN